MVVKSRLGYKITHAMFIVIDINLIILASNCYTKGILAQNNTITVARKERNCVHVIMPICHRLN